MNDLFRREVIDKKSQKHLGDVFLSSPISFWAITLLIVVIMAGLICVITFGTYARKERVEGVLTPSDGLIQIIPSQDGSYEEIYVKTGDTVQTGTPIIKLKDDTVLIGGRQLSDALLSQLIYEKKNLEARLLEISKEFLLMQSRNQTRKSALKAEAQRFVAQINVQERTVMLEENILKRFQRLVETESVSVIELAMAENRYLNALQNLNSLKNTRQKLLADVKDIEAELAILPIEQSQEEREVKIRISTLEQSILRTDARSASIIHAPISGIIATVTARKGQKATPQKTAISILPEGGELQAELFVPTRAIGFVKEGQSVRLLYDAFPYQKFGFYNGIISNISKTVVNSTDLPLAPQLSEPVFLVTVDLGQQSIEAIGEEFPLQSGMSLSADLILEDRKVWEWAFEPLLGALQ